MKKAKVKGTQKAKPTKVLVRRVEGLPPLLLADARRLIQGARRRVAVAVNAEMAMVFWQLGRRIREDVLKGERAAYGEKIVHALSAQLTAEFGSGYTRRNLFNMIRFAEVFPDERIVHTLCAQLSWSHLRLIIYLEHDLQRVFYAEMARIERWSTRVLQLKVRTMLFERTAMSKKPAKLIEQDLKALQKEDQISEDLIFRDPYFLDFLGLHGEYAEKDLEAAIIRELQRFILELGTDFAFVACQKRITVDSEDYYLDLLFYHRRLRRLVAIDLKLGRFQAADKGQMELYLRWLDAHERQPGEEMPIGLILCAGKSDEHVSLLRMGDAGVRVAQYMTELPPRKLLERKLRDAIDLARRRMEENAPDTSEKGSAKQRRIRALN